MASRIKSLVEQLWSQNTQLKTPLPADSDGFLAVAMIILSYSSLWNRYDISEIKKIKRIVQSTIIDTCSGVRYHLSSTLHLSLVQKVFGMQLKQKKLCWKTSTFLFS